MGRGRLWHKRVFWMLLIATAAPTLGLLTAMLRLPWIRGLELPAYDLHCRHMPEAKPDPRIVLIGMYDDTPEQLQFDAYPLPRSLHGRLVDALHAAGAKVIGFDMWFTAPAPTEDDTRFALAIKRHGRVVAALKADLRTKGDDEAIGFTEPEAPLRPYILPASIVMQRSYGSQIRWFLPYPADSQTSKRYLALPVALVAQYYGVADQPPVIRDHFRLGPIDAPIGSRDEIPLRFQGGPETFKPIRYEDVLTGKWRGTYPSNYFKDKIVLVGRISANEDNHPTPRGEMHGVEILANATQTLLQGDYIRHLGEFANLLCTLAACLLLALCFAQFGIRGGLIGVCIESLLWSVAADRLFVRTHLWIDTVMPLSLLMLCFVLLALFEAGRVRSTFHRLMPEQDAAQMLRSDSDAPGVTESREVTVVFCDIRNYTRLSEVLPAETVEALLHRFYTAGEQAAAPRAADGDLDKFVGDEMMLRFETKRRKESHALRAIRWAFAMQEFARSVDESGITGEIGFRIGIGISTGVVRVGTVSARNRIQATVIGDAVNVASRLQNATKEVGRPILLGPTAYALAADRIDAEPLGEITVKGKQEPVAIYCPLRIREAEP